MLPLIVSIISIFVVTGVTASVYVQAAKQRDLYNKRLAEVVGKTNSANQYEFEKNKDQEVSLERVRGDVVKFDGQISGLNKSVENVKAEYGSRIADLAGNVANVNQNVSKTLGQINQLTESQTEKIANLGGKVRDNSSSISMLTDKMAVIDGKLVNSAQQNSLVQNLVTQAETIKYEQGELKDYIGRVQNKSATDIADQNTSIANLQTTTTNRLKMQDDNITKAYNVAKSVQNLVTTLDTAIENVRAKFGDYFTKTDVNTKFASKADLATVNSTFGNYLSTADFNVFKSALPVYPTQGEMEVMLNSFLTQKDITQLSATLSEAQTSINTINQAINYIKSQYVTNEQIMNITGEIGGTVNIQGLYLTLQGLQSNLGLLQTSVTDVNNSLTTFKSNVSADYATKVDLQSKFDSLNTILNSLQQQTTNTLNSLTVTSTFTASGTAVVNDIALSKNYSSYPDNALYKDRAEISNDTNKYFKLMLVGNKTGTTGEREVGVYDNLSIEKNATAKGKITALDVEGTGSLMIGANGSKGWFKSDGTGFVSGNFGVGVAPTDAAFDLSATTKGTKQFIAKGGSASDWQAQFINTNGDRRISMNKGDGNGMQIITNDTTNNKFAFQTISTNGTTPTKTFEVLNDGTVNTFGNVNVASGKKITGDGSGITNMNAGNVATGVLGVGVGGTGLANPTANKLLVGGGTTAVNAPTNLHWDGTNLGIGNAAPTATLDVTGDIKASKTLNIGGLANMASTNVNGILNVYTNNRFAVNNNYMSPGSMTIGSTDQDYGGGNSGWNTNTAGLLMEAKDKTEIAVHDAGERVASLMYYEGGPNNNKVTIGRDMGWGGLSQVNITGTVKTPNLARMIDNRGITPNSQPIGTSSIGFGSFNNNNNAPWADVIHTNTWDDSSGGKQNAFMLNKTDIGARIYQGDFGSAAQMTNYKDFVMTNQNSADVNMNGSLCLTDSKGTICLTREEIATIKADLITNRSKITKAVEGSTILPGGLLMQWGTIVFNPTTWSVYWNKFWNSVTFPKAFTEGYFGNATLEWNGEVQLEFTTEVGGISKTNMTILVGRIPGVGYPLGNRNINIKWMAVGAI